MPTANATFTVKEPPAQVWKVVNDLQRIGSLIPEVTRVDVIDEKTADWEVTVKVGFLKRTLSVHSAITESDPPKHEAFKGESPEADMMGSVDLSPTADGGTNISYTIGAKGKGSLGPVIDSLLEQRLAKETTEVGDKLRKMLGE